VTDASPPWGVSKGLERALKREVLYNKTTGHYGVVMEDGMVEITSSWQQLPRVSIEQFLSNSVVQGRSRTERGRKRSANGGSAIQE